jgi:hypothetical protein
MWFAHSPKTEPHPGKAQAGTKGRQHLSRPDEFPHANELPRLEHAPIVHVFQGAISNHDHLGPLPAATRDLPLIHNRLLQDFIRQRHIVVGDSNVGAGFPFARRAKPINSYFSH